MLTRLLVAVVLAGTVGAVGAVQDVRAAVVLSQSGKVGAWWAGSPSERIATCTYSGGELPTLDIDVQPPRLWARDRTGGVDSQRVGYRLIIQKRTGTKWSTAMGTPYSKGTATDTLFAQTLRDLKGGMGPAPVTLRAVLDLRWYRKDGTVEGKVRVRVQWYEQGDIDPTNACSA